MRPDCQTRTLFQSKFKKSRPVPNKNSKFETYSEFLEVKIDLVRWHIPGYPTLDLYVMMIIIIIIIIIIIVIVVVIVVIIIIIIITGTSVCDKNHSFTVNIYESWKIVRY